MDKEEFKKLGENSNFIEGIYNYCDRWCERCPYTSKCMVFAMEKEEPNDPGSNDLNNEAFWDRIKESFRLAHELLEDWAEENDFDIDAAISEYDDEAERKLDEEVRAHPLSQKGNVYSRMVRDWLEKAEPFFEEKKSQFISEAEMGIDPTEKVAGLSDFIEIVQWYQYQIHVKLMRALYGRMDSFPPVDPIQNDFNGSAKVALLGIERSMAAWNGLLQYFEDQEDLIFPILVTLEQIKKTTLQTFPDAPEFIRPGFDES